ncbi:ZIP family metal transporter [Zoogloea sp. LCSB751]|uniref:ZIP family metal transporter n=1 Tax=Zoogloea sp. LCSB751 TaxID=1965277 RepID=UPI0009A4766A|nr:ZIP family metal transporter [Zoogloea sp. LCSB751]
MTPFTLCMLTCLAGGLLSVGAAAIVAVHFGPLLLSRLISYAVGALLGAAFLEILPHALEASGDAGQTSALVLGGVLLFFLLEKLVLWHHGPHAIHGHAEDGHSDDGHRRSGMLVMLGDSFHNFVDGLVIAAAFAESVPLGLITAAAIIAHEIPQELGDFVVLLNAGYSRRRALAFNLLSSLAMAAGALLAHLALPSLRAAVPVLLALACASMLYVAAAGLMPGLHRRTRLGATVEQSVLIAAGVLSIGGAHYLVEQAGFL